MSCGLRVQVLVTGSRVRSTSPHYEKCSMLNPDIYRDQCSIFKNAQLSVESIEHCLLNIFFHCQDSINYPPSSIIYHLLRGVNSLVTPFIYNSSFIYQIKAGISARRGTNGCKVAFKNRHVRKRRVLESYVRFIH